MKLDRKELLAAVDTVKPGLATKSTIDEFAHVWFNGKTALTFNDTDLGMEVPFAAPLKGGLRGALLLGMLNASRAKEVEIDVAPDAPLPNEILIKAGGMKLTMPVLGLKKTVWKFPDVSGAKPFTLTKDMLRAVDMVMVSTSDPEPSVPEKLGVTFEPAEDGKVNIYATDALTVSKATCAAPKGYKVPLVTMPTPFWAEVLRQCKEGGKLWVLDDCVIAENEKGVRIFAKLVNVERPQDWANAFDTALPKRWHLKKQAIPAKLPLAFQRAGILLEGHDAEAVAVTVVGDRLRMEAKSSIGELKEAVKLEAPADDVSVRLEPSLVNRGFKDAEEMLVTGDCFALFGAHGFIYLVGACI